MLLPGGAPAKGRKGLHLALMHPSGRPYFYALPGYGLVLTKLFRGGSGSSINSLSPRATHLALFGQTVKSRILSHPADQGGALGKVLEHGAVCEPAVGRCDEEYPLALPLIKAVAKALKPLGSHAAYVSKLAFLSVDLPLFWRGPFSGLYGGGCVDEVYGDHAGAGWAGLRR